MSSLDDAAGLEALCPACGYDLRGLPADRTRCPECGTTIDRAAPSLLPWGQRSHVGRVRAYLRTARLAMLDSRRLATEAGRPVNLRDAQAFRWVTIILAWLPLAIAAIIIEVIAARHIGAIGYIAMATPTTRFPTLAIDGLFTLAAAAVLYVPIPLCALLCLVLVSGVASYWFHPESLHVVRQNRAVALSYYACAPLALLFVPLLLIGASVLVTSSGWIAEHAVWRAYLILLFSGASTFLTIIVLWWFATMRLLRRTTGAGVGRRWLAGFLLPVTWLALAVLTLGVLPCVIGFLALAIRGVRG